MNFQSPTSMDPDPEMIVVPFSPSLIDRLVTPMVDVAERLIELDRQIRIQTSPFMSVTEAGTFLRCKPRRIYDLIHAKRLRPYKDGTRVLLRRDELEAYLTRS